MSYKSINSSFILCSVKRYHPSMPVTKELATYVYFYKILYLLYDGFFLSTVQGWWFR